MNDRRLTLVLAGGGARGAYEAGILRFVLQTLARRAGQRVIPRFITGTSAGAINGSYIAARTADPADGAEALASLWSSVTIEQVYRFETLDLVRSPLRILGRKVGLELSLVDARPLHAYIRDRIPWSSLDEALSSGKLEALVVAATEVAAGRCFHFMDRRVPGPAIRFPYPEEVLVQTRIRAEHTMASAAIPFLFPPIDIDGEAFQDGGLRQNTPLVPALRLGARRILVIGVKRAMSDRPVHRKVTPEQLSLTFLMGKALNALMLDPIERELHRVERMNRILEWGVRTYGDDFIPRLNAELHGDNGTPYHPVNTLFLRPSEDLGGMAAAAWASGKVQANRPTRFLLSSIANQEAQDEADLLSYLLFDKTYTGAMEALGHEDASRHEEEIAAFLGLGQDLPEDDDRIPVAPT